MEIKSLTVAPASGSIVGVPGPLIGAGLPGIVAACGGLLLLARRRWLRVGFESHEARAIRRTSSITDAA